MITGKCKYIQLVLNGAKTDIIDKTGILKCHDEYILANKVKLQGVTVDNNIVNS